MSFLITCAALLAGCGDDAATDTAGGPPAIELEIEDLGDFTLSDTGWYSDEIAMTVPEGTVSTMFSCGAYGSNALGSVYDLADPTGTAVYNGDDPSLWPGYRSETLDDLATGLLPLTPDLDTSPGTWNARWFVSAGNGGATVHCAAVHRVDTVSENATAQVNLVFVGLSGLNGLDATTAPNDPNFQAALTVFQAEWASGNLSPTFSYADFSGDANTYATVDISDDDASEFNELLATVDSANPRAITFFFVQEIANENGTTILGLSGGPPGAAATNGTSKSGVVVTTLDIATSPESVGKIMAHEGGHFLGLFHTSEGNASNHDLLSDTPECPITADANLNGQLNSDECEGMGAENVMWWTLTTGDATLSDDQSWVLVRNPAVD